jgi:hypothetical protein
MISSSSTMTMKPPVLKPSLPVALVGIAVFAFVGITSAGAEPEADASANKPSNAGDQEEAVKHIPRWAKWQRNIVEFDAMLRKLVETADIPEEEGLKKRLESESGWVEVITDGYGGVVDFNAAKGTSQHEANNLVGSGGPHIDWEFDLATDTRIFGNGSTKLLPEIARVANEGTGQSEAFRFFIRIAKADDGPFKAGDRVRLRASIDDFSRFKKRYHQATGLVAIHFLEESPNPVFCLRFDEAEVTLIKGANQDAGKSEPAEP